jgi:hypothetical protein
MIFINNKYTAIYYKIVDRANHRTLPKDLYKKHTDESNIKRRIANTGQVVPLEKRQAASEFHSNRPAELKAKYDQVHSSSICCIFCHRTSDPGTFKRWHGDNCKTNNCLIR